MIHVTCAYAPPGGNARSPVVRPFRLFASTRSSMDADSANDCTVPIGVCSIPRGEDSLAAEERGGGCPWQRPASCRSKLRQEAPPYSSTRFRDIEAFDYTLARGDALECRLIRGSVVLSILSLLAAPHFQGGEKRRPEPDRPLLLQLPGATEPCAALAPMFLHTAMRYYRLWIYTCNVALLLSALAFSVAAAWVLSDYRASLVPGLRLADPTFVYAVPALLLQAVPEAPIEEVALEPRVGTVEAQAF
ncbi:hypothetical protein HPB49_005735 [Dermacentor silvarum]|uniref:Uncharacterized protein n=1 Tax=Dermacentor silvarum TaxID=543639 RepID=A0ACB8CVG9_DERSI|nr:hypothetical protein HPB49_005735 [Dermacentor silvarum]